jgi:phosphoglycerol geranylgeranyltransferase
LTESSNILNRFVSRKGQIAVLIDPEKSQDEKRILELIHNCHTAKVDYIFIGGSTVTRKEFERTAEIVRKNTSLPLVIFPGSADQISHECDAILFLSLLSGRNPDFLIGHHIRSAIELNEMEIEVIPTSYLLIDGGIASSVAYVSQTRPIPRDHFSIVSQTAIAGKLQGKKLTYLDAGSGAFNSIPAKMVKEVANIGLPVIVGGGIKTKEQIIDLSNAGANVIVIGNAIEKNIDLLLDLYSYVQSKNPEL